MQSALDIAINKRGGYPLVAAEIGVTRQTLYRWVKEGVPAERAPVVEKVTGVSRRKLRPASGLRAAFLYGILLGTLIPIVQNALALLDRLALRAVAYISCAIYDAALTAAVSIERRK